MPNYIATVWHLSSAAQCDDDADRHTRRMVIREHASDPEMFKAQIRDRWLQDVDAEVTFGPVSLSKDQRTIY